MKPVKLLTLTSLNYLIIFLVLTLFFFAVFYGIIREEVYESSDEVLYNRKEHIIDQFKRNGGRISDDVFTYTNFSIRPALGRIQIPDRYSDTLIFEPVDREWDEFRKLSSRFELEGRAYQLEIVTARLETHEIVGSIVQSLVVVFILMVTVFYLTTRYFSKRLWQPFYNTLQKLNDFEVDKMQSLDLTASRIEEFVCTAQLLLETRIIDGFGQAVDIRAKFSGLGPQVVHAGRPLFEQGTHVAAGGSQVRTAGAHRTRDEEESRQRENCEDGERPFVACMLCALSLRHTELLESPAGDYASPQNQSLCTYTRG